MESLYLGLVHSHPILTFPTMKPRNFDSLEMNSHFLMYSCNDSEANAAITLSKCFKWSSILPLYTNTSSNYSMAHKLKKGWRTFVMSDMKVLDAFERLNGI